MNWSSEFLQHVVLDNLERLIQKLAPYSCSAPFVSVRQASQSIRVVLTGFEAQLPQQDRLVLMLFLVPETEVE